jgi:SAM-dependent methyltransferase
MDHRDHVALLAPGIANDVEGRARAWADIGAGSGAFTRALADLLGPGATIVAVDRDPVALAENERLTRAAFPSVGLSTLVADFELGLDLGPLDGLVAANSLHFVPRDRQAAVVRRLAGLLRPGGTFLVVEYDTERGNQWVPFPFTAPGWARIATEAGLVDPKSLARVPSGWLGGIYSASARRPAG